MQTFYFVTERMSYPSPEYSAEVPQNSGDRKEGGWKVHKAQRLTHKGDKRL